MKRIFCMFLCLLGCISASVFAYSDIDCRHAELLASRGIIVSQSTCAAYHLDRPITRLEAAAVVLRVGDVSRNIVNIPTLDQYRCQNLFADISSTVPSYWACRTIETLAHENVITRNNRDQYGRAFFYPTKNISQTEILAVLMGATRFDYKNTTYSNAQFYNSNYNYSNASAWQKSLMQYALNNNMITLGGNFGFDADASRSDVFRYAVRVMEMAQRRNGVSSSSGSFSSGTFGSGSQSQSNGAFGSNSSAIYGNRFAGSASAAAQSNATYSYHYKSSFTQIPVITPPPTTITYVTPPQPVSCGIGQYTSGSQCLSCQGLPLYAQYTTANSCLWMCHPGYSPVGNVCIQNQIQIPIQQLTTGQCGSQVNACVQGTFGDLTDNGNTAQWSCTGTNGFPISCFYNNPIVLTNGQCGTTINACTTGTFGDLADNGNTALWSCTGTNGSPISCSQNNPVFLTIGQCGTTVNSCIIGTFSDKTDIGDNALWSCTGTNGSPISCSVYNPIVCSVGQYSSGGMCLGCMTKPSYANYTTANSCDWTCQSGYHRETNTCVIDYVPPPAVCGTTANTCTVGSFSDAQDVGNYTNWICVSDNGNSIACSVYAPPPPPQCGVGQYLINNTCQECFSKPQNATYTTANSCDWTCATGYHREANTCVIDYVPPPAVCGTIANTCTVGTYSDAQDIGNYTNWLCVGHNGNSLACSVYAPPPPQCGVGQYLINNYCQACFSKPQNAHYTTVNTCDWACSEGHDLINNTCVPRPTPVPPQCGVTFDTCLVGNFIDDVDVGNNANWVCAIPDGTTVACTKIKIIPPVPPACGNGYMEGTEQCDAGSNNGNSSAIVSNNQYCTQTCTLQSTVCNYHRVRVFRAGVVGSKALGFSGNYTKLSHCINPLLASYGSPGRAKASLGTFHPYFDYYAKEMLAMKFLSGLSDIPSLEKYYTTYIRQASWGMNKVSKYAILDNNCNTIVQGIGEDAKVCNTFNIGTLGATQGTPVSLIYESGYDPDRDPTITQFAVDPSAPGEYHIWKASAKAPLLVYDPTYTSNITHANQLFGNWTQLPRFTPDFGVPNYSESLWNNGYEALSSLDTNNDKKVSGNELQGLGLWFDNNRDGVSQSGEVRSITSEGILSLYYTVDHTNDITGTLTVNIGYERIVGGNIIQGKSIDWYSMSAPTREALKQIYNEAVGMEYSVR